MRELKGLKTKTGITLIALVITIIVLLILAGISIMMLTGNNSILYRATKAKEDTIVGNEKEFIITAYQGVLANHLGKIEESETLKTELQYELDKSGQETEVSNGGKK